MSQILDICKLREAKYNENEVKNMAQILETKKNKVQCEARKLKAEVGCLHHENVLLDKQIICKESLCEKMENEISELKTKTDEAACSLESVKWKMYKTYLLKEYENEMNKEIEKEMSKHNQLQKPISRRSNSEEPQLLNCWPQINHEDNNMRILRDKVSELTLEIEKKKTAIQNTDPKLYLDIQILEKRNAALIVRYQRQLQETESRFRQTLLERNSLLKLEAEKNALLMDLNKRI